MSGDAHGSSPEKENHALQLRLAKAEAELRVVKAESDAKVADAKAAVAVAEAKLVQEKLERKLESAAHKLESVIRDHAAEISELLSLKKMRNLRGAVEYVSGCISVRLGARQIATPRGVQQLLDAALAHDAELQGVLQLLAVRHTQREQDVRQSFGGIYHTLSKGLHGAGDDVIVVRAVDFPSSTERLALCALLETYHNKYAYVNGDDTETSPSPYAVSAAERLGLPSDVPSQ